MFARIRHKSKYSYTDPVFLESNELRFFPRNDITQRVINFKYVIEPEPHLESKFLDSEGNSVIKTWFQQKTDKFIIDIELEVETYRKNPYDFIIDFDNARLPLIYSDKISNDLRSYLKPSINSREVKDFSDTLAREANHEILPFLSGISTKIKNEFNYKIRHDGEPNSSGYTLENKAGSCRDFSVLFMDICRYQGLASRFVSGYHIDADKEDNIYLHAWAEVFIPGGGWRGFDPTNNLATADRHIPIAASYHPANVAPITGSFRSNEAESELALSLKIEKLINLN